MADVRAVKNGNWSDTTVWNTGALPTTADDVYSNTFTVNVDTSFEVLSLRNTSGTGITAGGTFNFNSGSISASLISATGIVPAATNLITVTAGSGNVIISAPTTTITGVAVSNTQIINYTGNCDLNITAVTFNAVASSVARAYVINKSSAGTITINGNLIGGAAAGGGNVDNHALNSTAGSIIVNGNVIGNIVGSSNGTHCGISSTAGSLTVNGNVTGGGGGSAGQLGILFTGQTLTINGVITGGSTSIGVSTSATNINISGSVIGAGSVTGLSCTSAATISVTGSIIPSSAAPAISLSGASTFTYSGSLASSAGSPAIISTNISAINIFTGPFINTNNTMAVQCADMVLTQDASTFWNFGNITLFSPEQLAFYPSASDIRQGTTYADGTVSGSLAMPPPSAVIAGTPTDNTTGSAVLTPTQLQDAVWGRDLAQMTETGSIGYRLSRSATTDSTGKQIASYLL